MGDNGKTDIRIRFGLDGAGIIKWQLKYFAFSHIYNYLAFDFPAKQIFYSEGRNFKIISMDDAWAVYEDDLD